MEGRSKKSLLGCLDLFKRLFFIALLSVLAIDVCAQQHLVQGSVVDSNGEAIIGANVVSEDGKVGVITDLEGHFQLQVPVGTQIKISFIGYETKVVKATTGTMKVVLAEDSQMLGEVQVVAYGVQKKVTVTGAISGVKGEVLTSFPTGSISNMLAGPISGVSSVQYSGEPGADATLYIRGKATFGNAAPLVQVDGVERDLNDIDPNEIEDITVLKDASATAVFGVRGANGVILITTKRGSEGKPKISISSTESILFPTKLVEMANSYQYALYHNMMKKGDGQEELFSESIIEKFRTHSDPLRFPDTDWQDYVLKDHTFQTRNNINISGGTKSVRYFLSAGMYTEGGLMKQFDQEYDNSFQYRRFNYRGNVDVDVSKSTTISFGVSGVVGNSNRPYISSVNTLVKQLYWATPFSSPGLVDGNFVRSQEIYKTYEGTEPGVPFSGGNPLTSYYGKGYTASSSNKLTADVVLKQKLDMITKGLSFHLKGSYNSSFSESKAATSEIATYYPVLQSDGSFLYQKSGENTKLSYADPTSSVGRNWYMEGGFNYNRDFGLNHITALVLYNQSKSYYPSAYSDIPTGYVGLVGRVTYDWNNRYMLDFNVGYNGSENFAPGKRFGLFPSGSVGYIISEENFFKPLKKVINFMKFRMSWGLVGNDKIGNYRFYYKSDPYGINNGNLLYASSSSTGYGYLFGTGTSGILKGAWEKGRNNQEVTWEKSFKQNYGVDINFFEDRLKTSFDYYYERRRDIFVEDKNAPVIIGFSVPMANLGAVNSWGWELSAKWQDKLNDNFRYWLGGNISYNQNKIIEKYETPQAYDYMMEKDHRIGARQIYKFYKYYYEGIEKDYEKDFNSPFPKQIGTLQPGDCVYVDLNQDGVIDSKDSSRELNVYTDDPEYTVGIDLGFSWKKLDVSMQWTGAWNVSRQLGGIFRTPFSTNDSNERGGLLLVQYENSWTPENPSQDALYARPTTVNATNNFNTTSDRNVLDSKYLRLKNLNVAYHLDFPFMKKIKLNQCVVSLTAYNLLTFSPFKFGDPESRTSSDDAQYPLTRTIALGLKLGF